MAVGVLRRVVALETAAPLVIIAIASAVIELVASDLFLRSQLDLTLRLPGITYVLFVLGGLVGSLAIVGSTLPFSIALLDPKMRGRSRS